MDIFFHSYFALFLIISIGLLLGRIKFKGISLDISAVIFVALVFGHFGVILPKEVQTIGLILFIYSIGIQAGPGFFDAFRRDGLKMSLVAIIIVATGAIASIAASLIFSMDINSTLGIFAGALTSAPGLAAAIEASGSELVSIAYGVSYPFGVIGVILMINFLPKLMKINIKDAEKKYLEHQKTLHPELMHKHFLVKNPNIFGKTIHQLKIRQITNANISRIKHNGIATVCTKDMILHENDIIRAVGTTDSLEKLSLFVGPETDEQTNLDKKSEVKWVLVTNKEVVNKTLAQLNIFESFDATVTRIRRADIDLTPHGNSSIKFGDRLLIATRGNLDAVAKVFGNEQKKLDETDFFPISLGIVLGVLLGIMPIYLPGGIEFKLGLTGGVLAVTLILSRIGKTGPILWNVSSTTNQALRKIGLLFFLSVIGTQAGQNLLSSIQSQGIQFLLIGIAVTIIPMIVGALVGSSIYKINFLSLMGLLTGGMTSTPGLSAASSLTESDAPTLAYATVYPIAMVSLIIFVKIIYWVLTILA
jgi:putative transport protein